MTAELTGQWVHSDSIGYGRMATRLIPAIERAGVRVQDGMDDGPTNCVAWFSTPAHARWRYDGQHASILTMWESQRLAEGMCEGLVNFDVVMVPSMQNVELFSDHHDNVKLVLLGVDEQWHYRERKNPEQFFDFLIGGSGPRKGTDLAVAAFQRVFGDFNGSGPIPRLIMKNPRGEALCAGERIEMIAGKISAEAELDLYGRAHCYLQPSRGEGFGMQPLQAIAQGLPTILTDAHGHASFAHLGYGIGSRPVPADYFSHGFAGDWWEPDFDELCERMEWVYDNYDEARAFAKTAAQVAAETFTWDHSAQQLIDAIGLDNLSAPYRGSGAKSEHILCRYRVIVNKPARFEVAGIHYRFDEPGRVYWESADVLRILFDGGFLDPACLTPASEKGLTPSQVEKIPEYSASHAHCHACGQRLNSGPSRADDLMAANELERLRARVAELEGRVPA